MTSLRCTSAALELLSIHLSAVPALNWGLGIVASDRCCGGGRSGGRLFEEEDHVRSGVHLRNTRPVTVGRDPLGVGRRRRVALRLDWRNRAGRRLLAWCKLAREALPSCCGGAAAEAHGGNECIALCVSSKRVHRLETNHFPGDALVSGEEGRALEEMPTD